ncbi:MAG TPA: four helix bundle protein [Balneolaceae bacterium]|nr:four helix bundle protein [Balneolaceae bacterium]
MLDLDHKKLEVWRKSIGFVNQIYSITACYPSDEKFGIVSQLRRASVSVPSNISEGASRSSSRERSRFYEIARSSLVEVDTQLEISKNLGFVSGKELAQVESLMNEIFAMLSKMKQST